MFRRLFAAVLAMLAAGLVTSAHAQINKNDKWVLLGTRMVNLTTDKDTVDVTTAKGRFKAVRLEVKRRGIELSRVQVVYGNGAVHNEDRNINLNAGERTRPIDLRGEERFIDQINLVYKTEKGTVVPAQVEVWGLQSPGGEAAARPAKAPGTVATPSGDKAASGQLSAAPAGAGDKPTASGAPGQFGDVLFGVQYVGFGVDRDVIRVGKEVGKFDKIRLRVLDNDIFINELKLIYANGEPDTIAVGAEMKADTRSKWFPLKGDRFINEIQMSYKSKPSFKGQARIEVFGEYAEGWLGPQGEGRKFNDGWVLLGAQTAGFIGFDKDIIPVGKNEGGFRKIRVTVKDRAITLNELRVIYGSGQEDIIPVKTKVEAGATYGPVDLKGGTRVIKEVRAKYRSRFLDKDAVGKGAAIVEVWGKH
jgi:hypothetical protein